MVTLNSKMIKVLSKSPLGSITNIDRKKIPVLIEFTSRKTDDAWYIVEGEPDSGVMFGLCVVNGVAKLEYVDIKKISSFGNIEYKIKPRKTLFDVKRKTNYNYPDELV